MVMGATQDGNQKYMIFDSTAALFKMGRIDQTFQHSSTNEIQTKLYMNILYMHSSLN